jgi:hypothetical protein
VSVQFFAPTTRLGPMHQFLAQTPPQLLRRYLNRLLIGGKLEAKEIAVNRDSQARRTRPQTEHAPQIFLAEFVKPAPQPQAHAPALVGEDFARRAQPGAFRLSLSRPPAKPRIRRSWKAR